MTQINTYENCGVWRASRKDWLVVSELSHERIGVAQVASTSHSIELTIPEAEALVRHLRRAIRRQKARIAR